MLGKQLVVRRQKDGSFVVAAAPHRNPDATVSDAQKQQQAKFKQAILYARGAKNLPEYEAAAKARGISTHNVAVADFLHPPEIQAIDLSAYHGAVGQTIGITAVDDVKVNTVGVLITTDDGKVVERGAAVVTATDATRWTYTATAAAPSQAVKVVVDVADLAGHVTEKVEALAAAH
jgi:hypothetical protein